MTLTDFKCLECGVTERFLPEDLEKNLNPKCHTCKVKMADLTPFQKHFPSGLLRTKKETMELDGFDFIKYISYVGAISTPTLSIHIIGPSDELSGNIAKRYNKIAKILKDL